MKTGEQSNCLSVEVCGARKAGLMGIDEDDGGFFVVVVFGQVGRFTVRRLKNEEVLREPEVEEEEEEDVRLAVVGSST